MFHIEAAFVLFSSVTEVLLVCFAYRAVSGPIGLNFDCGNGYNERLQEVGFVLHKK